MQREVGARLRLRKLCARLKSPYKIEPVDPRVFEIRLTHLYLRVKGERNPQIGRAANPDAKEFGRSNADDRKGSPIDNYFFVQDLRIGIPLLLPITVTQHCRRSGAGPIVFGREHATKKSIHAQHRKVIAGNKVGRGALRRFTGLRWSATYADPGFTAAKRA